MADKDVLALKDMESVTLANQKAYRLVNSKYPPKSLFDDVADPEEFELLFELQARTNPRLQAELGNWSQLPMKQIPFGIKGCHYATAPFCHVNPDGSRFSDGRFGILYAADSLPTALAEVAYHQDKYWRNVEGLNWDRFVLRGLRLSFSAILVDAAGLGQDHPLHHPDSYAYSRELGHAIKISGEQGIQYLSARSAGHLCWGLMTPAIVEEVIQSKHYELIWNGSRIEAINQISQVNLAKPGS